jgi:septal ring factor EnvC (AmiA/AmiB activator)
MRAPTLASSSLCAALTLACGAASLVAAAPAAAQGQAQGQPRDAARAEADLKRLRGEIERIRGQIARDAAERDRLARSLRAAEQAATAARTELGKLRDERAVRERRRDELAGERRGREAELARTRDALAAQARSAYALGREDPLRMLLDQADPAQAGRMLAYHAFFGRARADQVARIEAAMREIERLDAEVAGEQQRIVKLEERQASEVGRLDQARAERGEVLAALTAESKARAASLQRMQREQEALERLLRELRRAAATQQFPSDPKSPFASLRGKLGWPAAGRVTARFGERRAGALKWDGVMIAAERGAPVRAVHRGRVVYADWLAGLGLLLIIDHGGGFLTLYGHNEQLFRAVGDVVAPGDTVAAVGDSGGRPSPGLYFEIRQAAKPVDPTPWFRTRQP